MRLRQMNDSSPYRLRKTMHMSPPAKMPMARKARMSAGEASDENRPVGGLGGPDVLVLVVVTGPAVELVVVDIGDDCASLRLGDEGQ